MDELQQALHKFEREHAHMLRIFDEAWDAYVPAATALSRAEMALAQAKRVRAASTIMVRAIARHRDQLQPDKEGTSE